MTVKNRKKGTLFILSAPSGCGKTTVMKGLLKNNRKLVRSISWTTREKRTGEKEGKDYFFVTQKKFLSHREKENFLEWARVFGQYYGTPKNWVTQQLNKGKDVLLVIDTRGARKVKKQVPCQLIFLNPPSMKVLRSRLEKRKTDSRQEVQKRLKEARFEMKQAVWYDYRVINNTVRGAVKEIKKIIKGLGK